MAPFFGTNNHPYQTKRYNQGVYGGESTALTKSFLFDGTDDFLRADGTPIGEPNRLGTGDASWGCHFKIAAIPSGNEVPFSKYSGANPNGPEMTIDCRPTTGYVRLILSENYSFVWKIYETQTNVCDNAWHHICCTFDQAASASVLKIYIDGSEAAVTKSTDNAMSNIKEGTARFKIGANGNASDNAQNFFGGYVTGVFGMNYLLDATEVAEMAEPIKPSAHSQAASLLYAYTFDDPADDATATTGQINDTSGNGGAQLTPYSTAGDNIKTDVPT